MQLLLQNLKEDKSGKTLARNQERQIFKDVLLRNLKIV